VSSTRRLLTPCRAARRPSGPRKRQERPVSSVVAESPQSSRSCDWTCTCTTMRAWIRREPGASSRRWSPFRKPERSADNDPLAGAETGICRSSGTLPQVLFWSPLRSKVRDRPPVCGWLGCVTNCLTTGTDLGAHWWSSTYCFCAQRESTEHSDYALPGLLLVVPYFLRCR